MAGLSVVLERGTKNNNYNKIVNKASSMLNKDIMIIIQANTTSICSVPPYNNPPQIQHYNAPRNFESPMSPTDKFLDSCFLCTHKLSPGKDIYMYKGYRAFCSIECGCKQILMDEEENKLKLMKIREKKRCSCSLVAIKNTAGMHAMSSPPAATSDSSSTSTYAKPRHHGQLLFHQYRRGPTNQGGGFTR